MVAEIKPRLATNVIFTTAVVSLLTWKYQFTWLRLRHIHHQDLLLTNIHLLQGTQWNRNNEQSSSDSLNQNGRLDAHAKMWFWGWKIDWHTL